MGIARTLVSRPSVFLSFILGERARGIPVEVATPHSFTGRMCAGSRYEEHRRSDALFEDPAAYALAGRSGRARPMGTWILVPRTRFGDDLLFESYKSRQIRQLVLLGAGFDSRAFRRIHGADFPELRVFEVDQPTTFEVKEPILEDLLAKNEIVSSVQERHVIATDFSEKSSAAGGPAADWVAQLENHPSFDKTQPTLWLLEGLMMYLTPKEGNQLMKNVGALSAENSIVFHDACSASYIKQRVNVAGAPFVGGSDDYAAEWAQHGGFDQAKSLVHDFADIHVDRRAKELQFSGMGRATPERCQGQLAVLFVVAEK